VVSTCSRLGGTKAVSAGVVAAVLDAVGAGFDFDS